MPRYQKCSTCSRTLLWVRGSLVCVNAQCPGPKAAT